jgi:MGT family glycosyltransferase
MTRYLFAVPDGGGTTAPDLSVAGALVRRGHDVRVLADPVLESEVAAVGARFRPWTTAPHRTSRSKETEIVRDWEARTPFGSFASLRDAIVTGPAGEFCADTLAELHREPADAVVSDAVLFGAQMAAEVEGLPRAVMLTTVDCTPAPGRPPLGPGLMPATGPLGRARDAALAAVGRRMWNAGLPDLNAARARHGLEPLADAFDVFRRADRMLVLTSATFDFGNGGGWPNVVHTGPRLDDPAWTGTWEEPPGDDPLVLVGLSSTYQDQTAVLRRIAAALGRLPVRGLITLGPSIPLDGFAAPANVTVVEAAPHSQVLPQASLVVTHAGHGTAIRALAHGVPLVCLPMGRDQLDVAARVVAAGAGVKVRPGAPPRRIARAVTEVLSEPAYRTAAGRLAQAIARETAEDRAAAELEGLVPTHA